jgi:hypothetical protein
MSVAIEKLAIPAKPADNAPEPTKKPTAATRKLSSRVLFWIRRGHLYLGLFLFPWAMLYGVTAFLFNHPGVAPDLPVYNFQRSELTGTELETLPSPGEQAEAVVAALNHKLSPAIPLRLADGDIRFAGRDTFIAMVRSENATFSISIDHSTATGAIRSMEPEKNSEKPSFAIGQPTMSGGRGGMSRMGGGGMRGGGGMGPMRRAPDGLEVTGNYADRIKQAIPVLLERKKLPSGDVTLTQSPELKFPINDNGKIWTASYNPVTTVVSGVPGDNRSDLSLRSFLLRLHLSRGYPGEMSTRFFWAVGVDLMALTMCFWGLSGLVMWWQIKSTRRVGWMLLGASTLCAAALAVAMHGTIA